MVESEIPDQRKTETSERQREWRARSAERLAAERADRLRALDDREESIRRALQAYRGLPGCYTTVRLRSEFIALADRRELSPALGGSEPEQSRDMSAQLEDDYRTRPPSTKLLMRKTHALQSYLSMVYVAHAEPKAGRPIRSNAIKTNGAESWAVLCGRWAPTSRARRARMRRDLDELLRADLVAIKPRNVQGRYENFGLLSDDSTGRAYSRPKGSMEASGIVALPHEFFTNGWHLALTPSEIAVLLMVRHAERVLPPPQDEFGIGLSRTMRWAVYGISGEAYESIHELEEFGLLEVHDTMPHRRQGKLRLLSSSRKAEVEASGDSASPVPYRLRLAPDTAFGRPALDIIQPRLRNNPVPPRLDI